MGNAKYKKAHREQGLCVDCPRPVLPGSIRCLICVQGNEESSRKWLAKPGHYKYTFEQNRKRRERYRESNRCIICSTPLGEQDEGCVSCVNCRSREMRATRNNPPISGELLENYYKKITKQS